MKALKTIRFQLHAELEYDLQRQLECREPGKVIKVDSTFRLAGRMTPHVRRDDTNEIRTLRKQLPHANALAVIYGELSHRLWFGLTHNESEAQLCAAYFKLDARPQANGTHIILLINDTCCAGATDVTKHLSIFCFEHVVCAPKKVRTCLLHAGCSLSL